jgi:hypothetical protein
VFFIVAASVVGATAPPPTITNAGTTTPIQGSAGMPALQQSPTSSAAPAPGPDLSPAPAAPPAAVLAPAFSPAPAPAAAPAPARTPPAPDQVAARHVTRRRTMSTPVATAYPVPSVRQRHRLARPRSARTTPTPSASTSRGMFRTWPAVLNEVRETRCGSTRAEAASSCSSVKLPWWSLRADALRWWRRVARGSRHRRGAFSARGSTREARAAWPRQGSLCLPTSRIRCSSPPVAAPCTRPSPGLRSVRDPHSRGADRRRDLRRRLRLAAHPEGILCGTDPPGSVVVGPVACPGRTTGWTTSIYADHRPST